MFGWRLTWVVALAGLISGCASTGTIESRKNERLEAYNQLNPEQRAEVDRGEIKLGMNPDAVYIAWGKPSQVLAGESVRGPVENWLYLSTYYEGYPSWSYASYYGWGYGHHYYATPYWGYDYYPRNYVRAEVRFESNKVIEWRSTPRR
jgi:hypothetical protein